MGSGSLVRNYSVNDESNNNDILDQQSIQINSIKGCYIPTSNPLLVNNTGEFIHHLCPKRLILLGNLFLAITWHFELHVS